MEGDASILSGRDVLESKSMQRDFVVTNLPSTAGGMGLIPGRGTKIPTCCRAK